MRIGIFGGTTEAHIIVDYLGHSNASVDVYVATLQGEEILTKYHNVNVLVGKKDEDEIYELLKEKQYDLLFDATHPYADIVSSNINNACKRLNIKAIRISRDLIYDGKYYDTVDDIIDYLNEHDGNVLLTTGSKNLKDFTKIIDYKERVYIRILPVQESLDIAINNEYPANHTLALYGPFDVELNVALIKQYNIKYLVTKNGGVSGGFKEKIEACNITNIVPLVLGLKDEDNGYSVEEAIKLLNEKLIIKKRINILGFGMGNINLLTIKEKQILDHADLIIGPKRLISELNNKKTVAAFMPNDILKIIEESSSLNITVVFSGDSGFYSGTKKLLSSLGDKYEINIEPGISSLSYLASKCHLSYENASIMSLHGRDGSIINHVNHHLLTFVLVGGENTVESIVQKLMNYELGDVKLYIGEELSTPNERITIDKASNLVNNKFSDLSSMFIENDKFNNSIYYGLKDECFVKNNVPLTKEEIRTISISKLQLSSDDIVYDIGAGTGSVGIEIASKLNSGKVYAIEKDAEALNVIKINKIKHHVDNLEIISGEAPSVLSDLEVPTKAFIGGSSGNLEDIIKVLLSKNEHIRIVLNAVTLETINEAYKIFNKYQLKMEVVMVNISKNRHLGDYNLMMSQNPIYIFSGEKETNVC